MQKLENIEKYISKIDSFKFSKFNRRDRVIDIKYIKKFDMTFVKKIYELVNFLQANPPPKGVFKYPLISEINLSYFSGCLYNYLIDIKIKKKSYKKTCWHKNCHNSVLLGYFPELDKKKKNFMSLLKKKYYHYNQKTLPLLNKKFIENHNGWLKYNSPDSIFKFKGWYRYFTSLVRKIILGQKFERIITLSNKIEKLGFDKKLYVKEKIGILGYSKISNEFMTFHGKHRLVILKYLNKKKIIKNNFKVKFPIIRYNFENFGNSSFKLRCKNCGKENLSFGIN